jgi:hypothetical protein
MCPSPADFFPGAAAASVDGRMGFVAVHQFAIAARWCEFVVCFLRAILVQVAATAPHAAWSLIKICPYMAKILTFIALCQAILVSVCLHLDRYVAKARQFEDILGPLSPGEGYEEKWKIRLFMIM